MQTKTVPEDAAGQRLDTFAATAFGMTRSAATSAVKAGEVLLAGERSRPATKIESGDTVSYRPWSPDDSAPRLFPQIIWMDESLTVVNKPDGLVTHASGGLREPTLPDVLKFMGIEPIGGTDETRPGIVHRLDRDVTGVLVVARNHDAFTALSEGIRAREVKREYLALVTGELSVDTGTIEAPLGRDPKRRTKMTTLASGRPSTTHFEVLWRRGGHSLLKVTLETGRTHQIRVHLQAIGHPILGDPLYGLGRVTDLIGRPALHAHRLRFVHPGSGASMSFAAPVPADLAHACGGSAE